MTYHVFRAPEGCCLEYCGARPTLEAAQEWAEMEPIGLGQWLWDTARAAGHCDGVYAPPAGAVDAEAISWHGSTGDYYVAALN